MVVMAVVAAVVTLEVMAEVMTVVVSASRILCSQLSFVSFQDLALADRPSRRPSTLSDP